MPEEFEYDRWNICLKRLNRLVRRIFFKEREVWWCSVGLNIGFEENGKGELFHRPVLILKKLSDSMFVGVPLSSVQKQGRFYYSFSFIAGKQSTALLSQIRVFDSKRLMQKAGMVSESIFTKTRTLVRGVL